MTPADIVAVDRLADTVCHDDQLTIWEDEVIFALGHWLVAPESYDDMLAMRRAIRLKVRDLIEAAFTHPEILGLPPE